MRRAVVLFSGGKDSVFAAFWALDQGFETTLLTVESEEYSMMFHHPNMKWTEMQAQAMGLAHIVVKTSKENELADLEKAIAKLGADTIVTGAVASEYQRQRIEQIGENLGIATHSPLWHKEAVLMEEMLFNFEIYTVAVSAEGLGKEFLGKPFSELVKKSAKEHPPVPRRRGRGDVRGQCAFFRKKDRDRRLAHGMGRRARSCGNNESPSGMK